ncbi:hypothetical protein HAZT_HAZT007140 [Hyalella azteca]|uniref:Uncharacterized protein n=1 Tax=Hyalella azteca TaxID=294128 RepID=A0A6A0GYG1_HYAAZ|nr:hypothetical protein HAZT_HAZT007140 [Hyalella azteca]
MATMIIFSSLATRGFKRLSYEDEEMFRFGPQDTWSNKALSCPEVTMRAVIVVWRLCHDAVIVVWRVSATMP